MGRRKKKLTFEFSGGLVEALQRLAAAHGTTVNEEVMRAVSDREFFTNAVRAGDQIILENPADPGCRRVVVGLL